MHNKQCCMICIWIISRKHDESSIYSYMSLHRILFSTSKMCSPINKQKWSTSWPAAGACSAPDWLRRRRQLVQFHLVVWPSPKAPVADSVRSCVVRVAVVHAWHSTHADALDSAWSTDASWSRVDIWRYSVVRALSPPTLSHGSPLVVWNSTCRTVRCRWQSVHNWWAPHRRYAGTRRRSRSVPPMWTGGSGCDRVWGAGEHCTTITLIGYIWSHHTLCRQKVERIAKWPTRIEYAHESTHNYQVDHERDDSTEQNTPLFTMLCCHIMMMIVVFMMFMVVVVRVIAVMLFQRLCMITTTRQVWRRRLECDSRFCWHE